MEKKPVYVFADTHINEPNPYLAAIARKMDTPILIGHVGDHISHARETELARMPMLLPRPKDVIVDSLSLLDEMMAKDRAQYVQPILFHDFEAKPKWVKPWVKPEKYMTARERSEFYSGRGPSEEKRKAAGAKRKKRSKK